MWFLGTIVNMAFVIDYQRVVEKMLKEYLEFVSKNGEVKAVEHLLTIGNKDLDITSGHLSKIITDLERIGAVHEENTSYYPAMVGDEFAYDKNGFNILDTEFQDVLYRIVSYGTLRDKFIDLNELIAKEGEVINMMEENELAYKVLVDINGFVCRADGSITYQGEPIACSRQDKLILSALLQRQGEVVNYEAIKDILEHDQLSNDTVNKYISRINIYLEKILGYRPIEPERGIGQRLQFRH